MTTSTILNSTTTEASTWRTAPALNDTLAKEVLQDGNSLLAIGAQLPPDKRGAFASVSKLFNSAARELVTEATLTTAEVCMAASGRFGHLRSLILLHAGDGQEDRGIEQLRPGLSTLTSLRLQDHRGSNGTTRFEVELVRKALAMLPNLERLEIEPHDQEHPTNVLLPGSVLGQVGQLSQLQELSVRIDRDCTAAQVEQLAACKLRLLRMQPIPQQNGHAPGILEGIGKLAMLENLSIHLQHLPPEALTKMSTVLGRLESLHLRVGNVDSADDFDLQGLSQAKRLTSLELEGNYETDSPTLSFDRLAPITTLKGLTHLGLRDLPIGDDSLQALGSLTALKSLDLGRHWFDVDAPGVHGSGLAHLRALTCLEALNLDCHPLTDDDSLRHIAPLKSLRRLDLEWADLEQIQLSHLISLPKLEELYLYNAVGLTGRHLTQIASITTLKRLDLSGDIHPLDTSGWELSSLNQLKNLEELNLFGVRVSGFPMGEWVKDFNLFDLRDRGCRIMY